MSSKISPRLLDHMKNKMDEERKLLTEENLKQKKKIDKLSEELQYSEQERRKFQEIIQNSKFEDSFINIEVESSLEAVKKELQIVRNENKELAEMLISYKDQNEDLKMRLLGLGHEKDKEVEIFETKISTFQEEVTYLQDEITTLQEENEKLKENVVNYEGNIDSIEDLNDEITKKDVQLQKLKMDFSKMKATYEEEINNCQAELQGI